MEALVGRTVRKAFPGYGTFAGVVESYDPDAGYFRVLYEDEDSEEVDEIAEILVGPAMPRALQQLQHTPPRDASGWRPKKRCRRCRDGDGDGDEDDVSPTPSPDGVMLAVPAAESEESEPVTPAETPPAVVEKKRRASPAPGPESSRPLRRSARQAKAAKRAAEMEAAAAVAAAAEAEEEAAAAAAVAASTPQQSGRKRPRASGTARYRSVSRDLEEATVKVLPPKPELPPSSRGLDLGRLPVLDVFQVYSFLRAFSRQLFLSPFSLETFVAALRSTCVNPLIDWVHFALLRALKSHLEDFASEGDPSAVHCIRVDSCDGISPCYYYGQNDLHPLVRVLNACHPSYCYCLYYYRAKNPLPIRFTNTISSQLQAIRSVFVCCPQCAPPVPMRQPTIIRLGQCLRSLRCYSPLVACARQLQFPKAQLNNFNPQSSS